MLLGKRALQKLLHKVPARRLPLSCLTCLSISLVPVTGRQGSGVLLFGAVSLLLQLSSLQVPAGKGSLGIRQEKRMWNTRAFSEFGAAADSLVARRLNIAKQGLNSRIIEAEVRKWHRLEREGAWQQESCSQLQLTVWLGNKHLSPDLRQVCNQHFLKKAGRKEKPSSCPLPTGCRTWW